MNDDSILATSKDERRRVRLIPDTDCANPRTEFDHLTYVVDALTRHDNWGPLASAITWFGGVANGGDFTLFERYCRQTGSAVTLVDGDRLWYLPAEDFWQVPDPNEALRAEHDEYESWAEGDVWGYVIEELQHWTRTDEHSDDEEEDRWVETGDCCFGLITRKYAETAALEALEA